MTAARELPVLDAEIVEVPQVDLDALLGQPLQYPPALRPQPVPATQAQVSCRCGKGSVEAHGRFSCDGVLAIAAQVAAGRPEPAWVPYVLPVACGLAALAICAVLVWVLVAGVTALVAAVIAFVSKYWAIALVTLLFIGGGAAKCAGLHCPGCRG